MRILGYYRNSMTAVHLFKLASIAYR